MICWKCGHDNPDDKNYCSECGTSLWIADGGSSQNSQSTMDESQIMVCWKCGHLNPAGNQFCKACGTDIWHASSAPAGGPEISPQPGKIQPRSNVQPNPGYGGNSASAGAAGQEGGAIYIKIVAAIFAVIYLLRAIGTIPILFAYASVVGFFTQIFYLLIVAMVAITFALSAAMLFFMAMCLTKKNGEMMYLGLVLTMALQMVISVIFVISEMMIQRMSYWFHTFGAAKKFSLWTFVIAIFVMILFYVLFIVAGEKLFMGKSSDELKQMLKDFPNMLQEEIKQFSSKRAAAKPASVSTDGGNYNRPQTPPPAAVNPNQLKTNRGLFKYIVFGLLTCGIYGLYFYYIIAKDINTICQEDGENTAGLIKHILLSLITCGIYEIIWQYQFADRLYSNASRYGVTVQETGTTVLLWWLLGSICCGFGPFVALYIQIKNLNKMAKAYNERYFIQTAGYPQ